jgi:hypothetical protein
MCTNRHAHRRTAGMDRMWAGEVVVIAAGPFAVPTHEGLVQAVRSLAQHSEMTRVGWVAERGGRGWRTATDLDAFARACVHRLGPAAGQDIAALLQRVVDMRRPGLPLAVVACGDVVVLAIDHSLGDGYYMTRLLAAVVETACTGTVPDYALRPPTPHALASALWDYFGRNPLRVWKLGRVAARNRPLRSAPEPAAVPAPGGAGTPRPAASNRVRVRSSTPAALRGLKAWRREHATGLSTIPLTIAATELARRRIGIAALPSPLVLFDVRRYVRPGGADVTGNFCAGLRLHLADSGDAREIDAAIRAAVANGRPLAVLAAGAVRSATRRRSDAPVEHHAKGTWDMTYTHMGRPTEIARLPWRIGQDPFYTGMLPAGGPAGVTVGISETGNRINASASFDEHGPVEAESVAQVLDLLCDDPAALLEQHRLGRAVAPPAMDMDVTR